MAAFHSRSNSLPSRPNPFVSQVEEQLCRINSSKAASSSEIYNKLSSLQDLHDSADKLLLLPQTQQALSQEQIQKMLIDLSDASLKLLDLCSSAKDALVQSKELVRELRSVIRRKIKCQGTEVKKYFASRKAAKKVIKKAAECLKAMQTNSLPSSLLLNDQEALVTVTILKNVEAATLSTFESLFSFISGSKGQSRPNGWALVSKLMHSKIVSCDTDEGRDNRFDKIDAALQSTSKSANIQDKLKDLDMRLQDFEEGVDCLFRRLIKTRVSLLNILNH